MRFAVQYAPLYDSAARGGRTACPLATPFDQYFMTIFTAFVQLTELGHQC